MRIVLLTPNPSESELSESLAVSVPEHEVTFGAFPPEDATVAVVPRGRVDRHMLEVGALAYVQTIGTGYENIDLNAAAELGVWVANLPADQTANADSVAEHALLLMLALSRKLREAEAVVRSEDGRWGRPPGLALVGKTAWVVGLGAVGCAVARRLTAMGMRVFATRRSPRLGAPEGVRLFAATEVRTAVTEADFVVVCARPDPENEGMIDAALLAAMKPSAILVNVARGSLVDEEALVEALRSGRLGGAGLDVFREEPLPSSHPLLSLPNVVVTPHIGGVTDTNLATSLAAIAENIRRFARGELPRFLLNAPTNPRVPLRAAAQRNHRPET